jgi:hypothetical protein
MRTESWLCQPARDSAQGKADASSGRMGAELAFTSGARARKRDAVDLADVRRIRVHVIPRRPAQPPQAMAECPPTIERYDWICAGQEHRPPMHFTPSSICAISEAFRTSPSPTCLIQKKSRERPPHCSSPETPTKRVVKMAALESAHAHLACS